eukprot:TRINITY_DN6847_c0_g1_i1.p1 TRINITY_DN6847_c0_g1~~TRINITY_DN6847_c0_g1_i1.p1  ORF type:complete len:522 (-),score=77.26 TRINITY_DN6847_c0_g1_i1:157-1686(-)
MWYVDDEDSDIRLDADDTDYYANISSHHLTTPQPLVRKDKDTTSFLEKCKDVNKGVALFGTVPPPKKFELDKVREFANFIGDSVIALEPDAVQIYDIVEEKSRSGSERPFPFFATHEPRLYCKLLTERVPGCECIIYRALQSGQMWYVDDEDSDIRLDADDTDYYANISSHHLTTPQPLVRKDKDTTSFLEKCKDVNKGVALFGTVPPPKKFELDKVREFANFIGDSVIALEPDAVQIYDIVEEKSRSGSERPFPFFATHEPRLYCKLLTERVPGCECIIYRALQSGQSAQEFQQWLNESSASYYAKNLVIVGGVHNPGESILTVRDAVEVVKESGIKMNIGGITIAERHRDRGDEALRVAEKVESGVIYFTSQVVYNADNAIWLLEDYDRLTKTNNKTAARIIFAFAPFASETTLHFLRWLGVEIPDGTAKRILSKPNLVSRANASVQVCWENWKRILDACRRMNISVPLGFSVEAVSKSKVEQESATALYRALKEEMDIYYKNKGPY